MFSIVWCSISGLTKVKSNAQREGAFDCICNSLIIVSFSVSRTMSIASGVYRPNIGIVASFSTSVAILILYWCSALSVEIAAGNSSPITSSSSIAFITFVRRRAWLWDRATGNIIIDPVKSPAHYTTTFKRASFIAAIDPLSCSLSSSESIHFLLLGRVHRIFCLFRSLLCCSWHATATFSFCRTI